MRFFVNRFPPYSGEALDVSEATWLPRIKDIIANILARQVWSALLLFLRGGQCFVSGSAFKFILELDPFSECGYGSCSNKIAVKNSQYFSPRIVPQHPTLITLPLAKALTVLQEATIV
jgi:hypothetical protein